MSLLRADAFQTVYDFAVDAYAYLRIHEAIFFLIICSMIVNEAAVSLNNNSAAFLKFPLAVLLWPR